MVKDPVESLHQLAAELRAQAQAFAMATVIEVQGSASALTGSKAIFDPSGKNVLGWVGGGCAERFIGEQAVEALKENRTRIVLADLDDEIFGLGVACGGKMQVFIEPVPVPETVSVPVTAAFHQEAHNLARAYGWNLKIVTENEVKSETFADLFLKMSRAIGESRPSSLNSLRDTKDLPHLYTSKNIRHNKQVTLVGRTRITEALARHFALLSYDVRAVGPSLQPKDYPSTVQCHCLEDSYEEIQFRENEIVIIASHTAQDPRLVKKALAQKAAYVAMVGSRKRAVEVLTHLEWTERAEISEPLYVPAGLDIQAKNPDEIALSIVAEVLFLSEPTP